MARLQNHNGDPQLTQFFESLRAGISAGAFLGRLAELYCHSRTTGMTANFRLGAGPVKRLRDEITPLARYLRAKATPDTIVQVPDRDPPDFVLTDSSVSTGVECTIAGGKERYFAMLELNRSGLGRGFIGLPDSASNGEFRAAMVQPRETYSTALAYDVTLKNVRECLRRKGRGTYGDVLIIEGNTLILSPQRWIEFQPELQKAAATSNFRSIFFVGYNHPEQICLQIK